MKFAAKDQTDPKMVRAAEVATSLFTDADVEAIQRATLEEYCRQVFYGLEPSEGIPDIRPHYPRWSH